MSQRQADAADAGSDPDMEPTHRQMLTAINHRLDGLLTEVREVKDLATEARDGVLTINAERHAERRIADRAAMADALRPSSLSGSATPSAAPSIAAVTGLRRWGLIATIVAAIVAILGGLGSAVKISIEVGHAVVKALTHTP